ncbi:MAG: DEAD/DEAH box helicase [Prevotellaceae bacterium]|jgi:superfamily II DNA or RNA helicase|nr:DEAD/DEAH box helicase [Prevotellaceae bacterium]
MEQPKIDFYQSLSDEEKQVLKLAAFKAVNFTPYDILQLSTSSKIKTQKQVRAILDAAAAHDLFSFAKDWNRTCYVELDFMLYIYPELVGFELHWKGLDKRDFYVNYSSSEIEQARNCLYALLYCKQEEYKGYEKRCIDYLTTNKLNFYSQLIRDERYEKYLYLIDRSLIENALQHSLNATIFNLDSLDEASRFIQRLELSSKHDGLVKFSGILTTVSFFAGRFGEINTAERLDKHHFFIKAVAEFVSENKSDAFSGFDKGLKLQRQTQRGVPLPTAPYFTFYYLALLLSMDTKGTPALQKINQWMGKTPDQEMGLLAFFRVAIDNALNKKEAVDKNVPMLTANIQKKEVSLISLVSLLSLYLAGKKLEATYSEAALRIVEKARLSGYLLLAYEAAYAVRSWFGSEPSQALFHEIACELPHQPALSQIARQEAWEKSLNMLLGLKSAAQKTSDGESKARVVYYFSPKYNEIQPVLQTRQAKGWSVGRNIALKSFFEGKTQGMTNQDVKIAKAIKYHRDYYSDFYEFSREVYPALVAHPYIFLTNSKDVPVEFVAAQPTITVAKSSKGYALSSDITDCSDKILLQKETNTRYKVYELTQKQVQILQIIQEQKIVVPIAGKEKLIALLGTFSAQGMNVHSDLLASESAQAAVKEVPTDSRIRVQLLPFGDGLKAELFVKPFGTHPPYCKPGKGGKVLISNEKNMQLQVKRDLKAEADNETLLLNEIQTLESLTVTNDLMAFDDPLDSLHLLDILAKYTGECVVEWPEGERYKIRGTANFDHLHLTLKSGLNWFDLQGELKVDEDTVLSLQQLLSLTARGHNRFIELSSGEFIALSKELKKQLDALRLYSTTSKNEIRLNKFASVALDDFFENAGDLKADKAWRQFQERLSRNPIEAAIPDTLQAELRSYQEDGFRWMARLAEWEGGACLADDMGLGKTVQALALLLHRAAAGPALVVCPVSVIGNWVSEAARFAPTLRVKTLGNVASNRQEIVRALEAGDLLVTSYGLLQSEEKLFSEPSFATAILDEAHAIKNYATKTSKASMQLKAAFRVALTGTPVQNNLGEVWNLFNFTNPGLLGSLQHFTDTFIKPDDEATRKYLKKLITPFILRRTKSAVLDELPPKTEIVKKIQLSGEEMAFYEALRRQALENLSDKDNTLSGGAKQMQVLAEITKLRLASCNPLLIDKDIRIPSSKLAAFLEIASELKENKHRALVFSQFVMHLSVVRKALDEQGITYQYLDGSSPMAEREKSVRRFQGGEGDLFLISLKAGGLGLNLTAADYVIHLDPWWNPAIEDQASDRAHRIGQTRPVTIYRLVAENTIEEKIIHLHSTKRDLAESLLEGSDRSANLSLNELIALIKERD